MKKIRNFIIHLLGGYTQEDAQDIFVVCDIHGECINSHIVKSMMDDAYGKSAEKWKQMYSSVSAMHKTKTERYKRVKQWKGYRRYEQLLLK